jgi:hypothetical protein
MNNISNFTSQYYQRHNQRRQEHLASLGLLLTARSVLEVGAGIGDHSSFFLDRGCDLTSTDGRADVLEVLKQRYPGVNTSVWDLESPPPPELNLYEIIYAYGVLYHTSNPEVVLKNLSSLCIEFLLLETCVSFGNDEIINLTEEVLDDPTQALRGAGCRPTRVWVFKELKKHFPFVYLTRTQPAHEEFPTDWSVINRDNYPGLVRSVFVASKSPLLISTLSSELMNIQLK